MKSMNNYNRPPRRFFTQSYFSKSRVIFDDINNYCINHEITKGAENDHRI